MVSTVYGVAGFLAILGIFIMIFPNKTRESIFSTSNAYIRYWGTLVIVYGATCILFSCIFVTILYLHPYMLENVKNILSMEFIILRHFFLSSVFSLGVGIILMGIIVIVYPIKVKRIAKESSDVKIRLFGLLIIGLGVIDVLIIYVFYYISYLQKQLLR